MLHTPRSPVRSGALALACLAAVSSSIAAQPAPGPAATPAIDRHARTPTVAAARRTGPLQVDGRLDEAEWQAATPVGAIPVLRWEYRPGSALLVVWQQQRIEQPGPDDFGVRRDLDALLGVRPENVFVIKAVNGER